MEPMEEQFLKHNILIVIITFFEGGRWAHKKVFISSEYSTN
jgi:hypothetical protein